MAKPKKSAKTCVDAILASVERGEMSKAQATRLLRRIDELAADRQRTKEANLDKALNDVAGEIAFSEKTKGLIDKRNMLLSEQKKRAAIAFIKKFPKWGTGLKAFLEGSNRNIPGARLSVDAKARATHKKYFGKFVALLEKRQAFRDFRQGKHELDIYKELEARSKKLPRATQNKMAHAIADAIYEVRSEMIARQNQAGAFITRNADYVVAQTHDAVEVRRLGKNEDGTFDQKKSFEKWYQLVLPLIDVAKTTGGESVKPFLREFHANIYHAHRTNAAGNAQINVHTIHGAAAKKASREDALVFKDGESAYKYNQVFGTKHLRDAMTNDLLFRSRSIALMESLGPSPRHTFDEIIKTLKEEAKEQGLDPKQAKSLDSEWIERSFREVTGEAEMPANVTSAKIWSGFRIMAQLSKMGGTMLSAIGDKAFMQSDLSFVGVSRMESFLGQLRVFVPKTAAERERLKLYDVALDGLMGTVASRWSVHSTVSGTLHRAQQRFFDLNFLNWWTDSHKAVNADLLSGHLGLNSHLPYEKLDVNLRRTLDIYDITPSQWEVLRHYAEVIGDSGHKYMTPDIVKKVPRGLLHRLVEEKGHVVSDTSLSRMRQELEDKLRVLYADRSDIAVPTPGIGEKKFTSFGLESGTFLGEVTRTLMLFKSFPITVVRKVLGREFTSRIDPQATGFNMLRQWMTHDHLGKFRIAQLIAMATIGGYLSGAIKDALKGRTPKKLVVDGEINWRTLNDAALRGGGLGILGDFLFSEYDRQYRSFVGTAAGPVFGQMDPLMDMFTRAKKGEPVADDLRKFALNNTPFLNLFYIRPVLDYFVLWNIQEMLDPGSLARMQKNVEEKNAQEYFIDLPY